jgi:hypothetical protein
MLLAVCVYVCFDAVCVVSRSHEYNCYRVPDSESDSSDIVTLSAVVAAVQMRC